MSIIINALPEFIEGFAGAHKRQLHHIINEPSKGKAEEEPA